MNIEFRLLPPKKVGWGFGLRLLRPSTIVDDEFFSTFPLPALMPQEIFSDQLHWVFLDPSEMEHPEITLSRGEKLNMRDGFYDGFFAVCDVLDLDKERFFVADERYEDGVRFSTLEFDKFLIENKEQYAKRHETDNPWLVKLYNKLYRHRELDQEQLILNFVNPSPGEYITIKGDHPVPKFIDKVYQAIKP